MAEKIRITGQHEIEVSETGDLELSDEELMRRKDGVIHGMVDLFMGLRSDVPLNHLIPLPMIALCVMLKSLAAAGSIIETEEEMRAAFHRIVDEVFEAVNVSLGKERMH